MKKRSPAVLILLCALLFSFVPSGPASAEEVSLFSFSASAERVSPGGTVSVTCTPNRQDIGAFVLFADFDEDAVSSVRVEMPEGMKNDYVYTSDQGGRFALVYTAKDDGALQEPFVLTFRTSRRADFDMVTLDFSVTDVASVNAESLLDAAQTEQIVLPCTAGVSGNAKLLSLAPPTGVLSPEFDPDTVQYTLTVPFSVTSLVFDAQPAEGCTVRVNRKNLGAGGSTVDFKFTVTASDGARTVYTVAVTRGKKETGSTNSAGKTVSSQASGGKDAAENEFENGEIVRGDTEDANGTVQVRYNGGDAAASRTDRLETAGIVLLSVAFGLTLAVLIQRVFDRGEKKADAGKPKHGR